MIRAISRLFFSSLITQIKQPSILTIQKKKKESADYELQPIAHL
jgi:hypothetical protein